MSITTQTARITTYRTLIGEEAIIDVYQVANGTAVAMRLLDVCGGAFYLCVRKDDPNNAYLVAAPSAKWKGDVRDDGFTIIQRINPVQLNATADHHEKQNTEPTLGKLATKEGT